MGPDGRLLTTEGHPVLSKGEPGSDPASRYVSLLGREGALHINDLGEVFVGDDRLTALSVVEFANLNQIRKAGGLYFENKNPTENPPLAATVTQVKQGMIEASNVNPVEELSNLIKANRLLEQDLKAMKTVNEMLGKEVNDIGKF
jgi:flagellar basal body rod protein FlgG